MPRRTPSAGDARNARARGAASRREARTRANALHPELSRQVREVVAAADGTPVAIDDLLARISRHYVDLEQESRTLSRALRRAATRGPAPPAAASPVSASPSPPSSAEGEARYRSLVEHAPEAIVVFDAGSGLLVDANLNAEALFGQPVSALLGRRLLDFAPARQPDGQDTAGLLQAQASRALAGEPRVFDWVHGAGEGADLACEMRLARLPDAGGRALVRCSLTDISTRRRAQLIAAGERAVLENVAANAPLERSLEAIAGLVESVARDGIAVVSVVSVEHPRFERTFLEEIENLVDAQECYALSGDYGYRLKIRARDLTHFETILRERIQTIRGVSRTRVELSLSVKKDSTLLPLV